MVQVLVALCAWMGAAAPDLALAPDEAAIEVFAAPALPANLVLNNVAATLATSGGANALRVDFKKADWPNVFFKAPNAAWDWSEYLGLAVDVENPGSEAVDLCCRVDNEGGDGLKACNTGKTSVRPGERKTFRTYFNISTGKSDRFWGMRGVPGKAMRSAGPPLDRAKVVAFQYFLPTPQHPQTLLFSNIPRIRQGPWLGRD